MSMRESADFRRKRRLNGQSIVEMAMMAPILILIISGVVEMGFMFSNYLAATDAARNAARFSSDSNYINHDHRKLCTGAGATTDFYRQTACLAIAELANESPTITLCLPNSAADRHCPRPWAEQDDVIISVFAVTREITWTDRSEWLMSRFPGSGGEHGWSYAADLMGGGGSNGDQSVGRTAMHSSNYSTEDIRAKLDPVNINSGFVLVEINYNYYQILALPWFTAFVPDPQWLKLYSVWPLTSAEPTHT
jgi:hypothetical protein